MVWREHLSKIFLVYLQRKIITLYVKYASCNTTMKNVASIKCNSKNESPKTPGGISRSLLTPCRRVGLSRNWKKKGPSPFISPLTSNTSNNVEPVVEKKETRKRKSIVALEEKSSVNVASSAEIDDISVISSNTEEIVKTPLRNVELPRRKKSKTFLATLNSQACTKEKNSTVSQDIDECTKNETVDDPGDKDADIETSNTEGVGQLVNEVSPQLKNSKLPQKKTKFQSPLKSTTKTGLNSRMSSNTILVTAEINIKDTPKEVAKPKKKRSESKPLKTRSPNELTKECIVVIQKKLFKVKEQYNKGDGVNETPKKNSQPLFDSDDETPLSTLNKKENNKSQTQITTLDDDDEFIQTSSKNKSKKTESDTQKMYDSKKTSKADNKVQKPIKPQVSKIIPSTESKPPSQNSFDDDDDDFLDKKRTILIRKSYEKVVKPNKAKSTGSITQRDIDDLKARIEHKKKMLFARSMTTETEELRSLIKKWQKGCQDALVELMDLMKIKCPDKHSMDYSEILQMLKIPASMVGYDSDHDCFNTPDDTSAVLSKYNDF